MSNPLFISRFSSGPGLLGGALLASVGIASAGENSACSESAYWDLAEVFRLVPGMVVSCHSARSCSMDNTVRLRNEKPREAHNSGSRGA